MGKNCLCYKNTWMRKKIKEFKAQLIFRLSFIVESPHVKRCRMNQFKHFIKVIKMIVVNTSMLEDKTAWAGLRQFKHAPCWQRYSPTRFCFLSFYLLHLQCLQFERNVRIYVNIFYARSYILLFCTRYKLIIIFMLW